MTEWHIITCEYPPQLGGVSDFVSLVASGLAREGNRVHVWCPPAAEDDRPNAQGVIIHPELGRFTPADLRRVDAQLGRFAAPRRLFVQWVPHGYGMRAMNVPLCLWLWKRAAWHGDQLDLMVHEPFLSFREGSWKQDVAASVHRLMALILLKAARRVWYSIPAWKDRLRPYTLGRAVPFRWLPVPSNLPTHVDPLGAEAARKQYAPDVRRLIGYFGTCGPGVRERLIETLCSLLPQMDPCGVLLIGPRGERVRTDILAAVPSLNGRIHATGRVSAAVAAACIGGCDVMLQPFPDGVTSRRTSIMAALALGIPTVTTAGALTEPFWSETDAVALAPADDIPAMVCAVRDILGDDSARERMGKAARSLYLDRFDLRHVLDALREPVTALDG